MKTHCIALIVGLGLRTLAIAQGPALSVNQLGPAGDPWISQTIPENTQAPGSASGSTIALASGTAIPAQLTKSLDVKKVKAGDEVTAKTTQDVLSNGSVVIRKGSKILGHVAEAQARTKENPESRLGIVFDHVVLKDGSALTFNSIVQALAAPPEMSMPGPDMGPPGGSMGANRQSPMGTGGVMGSGPQPSSMPSTVGAQTNPPPSGNTSNTGNGSGPTGTVPGTLNSTSQGVIGLQGLTLNQEASGGAQVSLISSDRGNVKLESGTLMILRATSPAPK